MTEAAPKVNYGRGFAWNFVLNFFTKIGYVLVSLYIANHLGPGPVGVYFLLNTVYNFAELMREAGLKQAYYNDPALTPEKYRTYGRLSLTSGISFGLGLAALAYPLGLFYKSHDLIWCMFIAAFAVAINGFSAIPAASMLKAGRFRDTGLVETAATFCSAAVALGIFLAGFGLLALMLQLLTRSVVLFVAFQWLNPVEIRGHDKEAVKPIMRVCMHLVATDILWMLYSLADMLLIPKHLGKVQNGIYGYAKRLIWMPAELVFSPLHRTIIVAVGNRAGDLASVGKAYVRSFSLAVLMLLPIYLCLAMYSTPLVHSILRRDFWPAAEVLPILCISEAARAMGAFAGTALVAAGKQKIPMYAWIIPYPVAGAFLAYFWSDLTLVKTAWSFSAGMVSVNLVTGIAAFRLATEADPEKKRLAKALGCTTITALAAYGLSGLCLAAGVLPWVQVLLALMLVPPLHLAIVGMVFAGSPTAYMSLSGLRRLKGTL